MSSCDGPSHALLSNGSRRWKLGWDGLCPRFVFFISFHHITITTTLLLLSPLPQDVAANHVFSLRCSFSFISCYLKYPISRKTYQIACLLLLLLSLL